MGEADVHNRVEIKGERERGTFFDTLDLCFWGERTTKKSRKKNRGWLRGNDIPRSPPRKKGCAKRLTIGGCGQKKGDGFAVDTHP